MPSTYTLNNGIELIATGEQSGTWGDTTNTNLSLLDTALDGQVTVTLPSAGTSGSPNTLAIADGSASDGRNRMVIFNDGGDLGATAYVQLTPNDAEKIIYIRNDLAGSRSIILFQGTYNASNDYEVPAGTTAVIYFDGAGSGAVAANVFNNAYFDSLRLGSVSVTAILDEDNMASDSATALATQQSIKAYVDSQVTAQDLDFGGDSGTGAVDLDSQTFTIAGTANEIETSASGQTLTVGLPNNVTIAGDLTVDTDTLYVDSANNEVGIGTSSPSATLNVSNNAGGSNSWTNAGSAIIINETDTTRPASMKFGPTTASEGGQIVWGGVAGDGPFVFRNYSTERLRIDSSGRILFGDSSSHGLNRKLQSVGTTGAETNFEFIRYVNSTGSAALELTKSRGTTVGGTGIVSENDLLGQVNFRGDDGVDTATVGAQIYGQVDGTPGANDMPGRISFLTTADGNNVAAERMRITSSGKVGIGVINPQDFNGGANTLVVGTGSGSQGISIYAGSSSNSSVFFVDGDSGTSEYRGQVNYRHDVDDMSFHTAGGFEAMRIDSSQRVLIGSTGSYGTINANPALQVHGLTYEKAMVGAYRYDNGAGSPAHFTMSKSRGTSVGTQTIVQSGDTIGQINFAGSDGTDFESLGNIAAQVDGTPGTNDMPGRLVFSTTPDGSISPAERMRINSSGGVLIGTTTTTLPGSGLVLPNDGIIAFNDTGNASRNILQFSSGVIKHGAAGAGVDTHTFHTSNIEAMRIDSSQRVIVGTTSTRGVYKHTTANNGGVVRILGIANGGSDALHFDQARGTITSPTASNADGDGCYLSFSSYDGTNWDDIGSLAVVTDSSQDSGRMIFRTTPTGGTQTQRMVIKSDGKVGIGITNPTASWSDGVGVQFNPIGEVLANKSNAISLYLNRSSSSGSARHVIGIYEDSSAMGYLGMGSGSEFAIVTPSSYISQKINNETDGIQYSSSGTYHLGPWISKNGSVDLGRSSSGWRDLYLTGGIQFDARSSKLDDYEEGFWSITSAGYISNPSVVRGNYYTKIGNMVYVNAEFVVPVNSSSSQAYFGGLPYATENGVTYRDVGSVAGNVSLNLVTYLLNNTTNVGIFEKDFSGVAYSQLSNKTIVVNFCYKTAS